MLSAFGANTRTVTLPSRLTSGETNFGLGLLRAARQAVSQPSSAPAGLPCARTSGAEARASAAIAMNHCAFMAFLPWIFCFAAVKDAQLALSIGLPPLNTAPLGGVTTSANA